MPSFAGTAKLKSIATGEILEVTADDLDVSEDGEERDMGPELTTVATYEGNDSKGNAVFCEWTATEYPTGAVNHAETKPNDNTELVQNFEIVA